MSFLKKLFGLGGPAKPEPAPELKTEDYRGCIITATPVKVGGEYQVCGVITRDFDGTLKEHKFIRVDRTSSRDEAIALIFLKGRQIIDQSGDRLFN